ncbi:MAG: hypothetical protein V9G16_12855 [Nitrosomonas sp.]
MSCPVIPSQSGMLKTMDKAPSHTHSWQISGTRLPAPVVPFTEISAPLALIGLLLASTIGAFGLSLFNTTPQQVRMDWKKFIGFGILLLIALLTFIFNDLLTAALTGLNSNWLFLIAVLVATLSGGGFGRVDRIDIDPSAIHPPDLSTHAYARHERGWY